MEVSLVDIESDNDESSVDEDTTSEIMFKRIEALLESKLLKHLEPFKQEIRELKNNVRAMENVAEGGQQEC